MPYPNHHSARVADPMGFVKLSVIRTTDERIVVVGGPLKTEPKGKLVDQEYRFPSDEFSPDESREWLSKNSIEFTVFEEAKNYGADYYAKIKTKDIGGVKIFDTGTWNDKRHSEKTLTAIVENTNDAIKNQGHTVALWLGHDKKGSAKINSGDPAVGWVEKLKVKSKAIWADFTKIPEKFHDWIEAGLYRRVSIGYMQNVKIGKKKYSKVLTHVALLGAETPAVSTSSDLLKLFGTEQDGIEVMTWDIDAEEQEPENKEPEMDEKLKALESDNAQLQADIQAEQDKAKAEADARKAAEEELARFQMEAEQRDIKAFCKTMTDGDKPKVPPSHADDLPELIASVPIADGEHTFNLGDDKKTKSPRKAFMNWLSGLGAVMTFNEKANDDGDDSPKTEALQDKAEADAMLKTYGIDTDEGGE